MVNMDKKKPKAPPQNKRVNYSKEEKADLLRLIKKYPVIYDKTTSNKGIKVKREAWKSVNSEFNRIEGHTIERTEDQLKKLWENTKSEYKKNLAYEMQVRKKEMITTGGGIVTHTFVEDPNMEVLLGITVDSGLRCEIRGTTDSLYESF